MEEDELLDAIKTYLTQATIAHSLSKKSGALLSEQIYTWTANDEDVRGLLHYILDATSYPRQLQSQRPIESFPDSKSSDECPQISKKIPAVAVDPATTISAPEASFIFEGRTQRRRPSSTTATILSKNNITEITWQASLGRLEAAGDPLHSPIRSDVARVSPDMSSDETRGGSRVTTDTRSSTVETSIPDRFGQDHRRTQQPNSVVVATNTSEPLQHDVEEVEEVEEAEENPSYLMRLRKKSIRLGHAIGSFMNGDYRNADHRPRRESTVIRLRSALDRIEPSRPKQNAAIFVALTGAQPIDVVDQFHARRPDPPSNTCSEDGR